MSPRIAKANREELPKTMVQRDALGFFPLNRLSVSYLHKGYGNVILGHRDTPETLAMKASPNLTLTIGKKKESLDLQHKFFNGLSDAFYRGKLPQVVLATPDPGELNTFLSEFLEYVSSLTTLGYFLPKPTSTVHPVDEVIPCYIIASNGVFFGNFLAKLLDNLRMIDAMDEVLRKKILGKFTRGVLVLENQSDAFESVLGKSAIAVEPPVQLKIAGGDRMTQLTVQTTLNNHRLYGTIENAAKNPVERLELENALWRSSHVILPCLSRENVLSADEVKEAQEKVRSTIYRIGKQRHAFDDVTPMEALPKKTTKDTDLQLVSGDPSIFRGLKQYADMLGLVSESRFLADLGEKVHQQLGK